MAPPEVCLWRPMAGPGADALRRSKSKALAGHERRVLSVCWSADGARLASGSEDRTVKLWSVDAGGLGREIAELGGAGGHTGSVEHVCWDARDAHRLYSSSGDKTVKVWDARSRRCTGTVPLSGSPLQMAACPDGHLLAVSDRDDALTLVDVRRLRIVHEAKFGAPDAAAAAAAAADVDAVSGVASSPAQSAQVNSFAWDRSGAHLYLSVRYDNGIGGVEVVRTSGGELQRLGGFQVHTNNVYCLAFAPGAGAPLFAVGGNDSLVSLWDASEMACVQSYCSSTSSIYSIAFSGDGSVIAYGSGDATILLDETASGCAIGVIKTDPIREASSLAWHPTQNILAYCGDEGKSTKAGFVRIVAA